MTTTVRLKSCPRCKGALSVSSDIYGAFWRCAQCGFHDNDAPQPPSIRRAEAMKAYHTFFEYAGPQKTFQGYRLRGRLLPRGHNYNTETFDLLCPYPRVAPDIRSGTGRTLASIGARTRTHSNST